MKNKNTFNTIITVAFVLLAFVLLVLLSAGIRLEFDRLADGEYWANIVIRLAIMLLLYNVIFVFDLQKRKAEQGTAHYLAVGTKQLRVNRIKRENMFDRLGEAVEAENDERYRATCTNLINKVCLRLRYEDLPAEKADLNKWLADTKERLYLGDRDLKRVRKVVLKILNGKVRYEKLTADDILDMLGEANVHSDAITFQSAVIVRRQNFIKALTFLAGVVAMTVFRYYPTWTDFIFDVIVNATLLVGATYSAIINSKSFLKRKTTVVENQNIFLARRMGLTDEYNGKSGA